MTHFKQRRINKEFLRECEEIILGGRSAVLIGPRFGGKRGVQEHLLRVLPSKIGSPILSFSIAGGNRAVDLDSIHYLLLNGPLGPVQEITGNPIQAARELAAQHQQPVIMLAGNVDSLPHEVARSFLEQIRVLVEESILAAILSGELDLRDLVHGTHSEFNCAEQFVLQGFDRDIFHGEFTKHSTEFHAEWGNPDSAEDRIWQITGGNSQISRLLIAVAEELRRRRALAGANSELSEEVLDRALQTDLLPTAYWTGVLRRPIDLIEAEPDCSLDLETLLATGAVPARNLDGAPGVLELSGLGIRMGETIQFASPFMERLAKRHFTPRRLADLYAHNGQWEAAFERYAKLSTAERVRSGDGDDRRALHVLLQSLTSAMFASATVGTEKVRDLMVRGANFLLGFPEVSFWKRHYTWEQLPGDKPVPVWAAGVLEEAIPTVIDQSCVLPLPESIGRFALAAGFNCIPQNRPIVVVLSGFGAKQVLAREWRMRAHKLLESFVQAYDQAAHAEFNAKRLEARNLHVKILNGVFDFLGSNVFDIPQILELTGNELLNLGYRRVMFSLVDSERKRIQGVLDCPKSVVVKLAEMTDYPLNQPPTDIQQYVVQSARYVVVDDTSTESLVHPKARDAAVLKAFAVVPILNRANSALGTIHIERTDDRSPTSQEIEDLELFGRQLARILGLHERMTLVQKSLDGSTEPLMIANKDSAIVYANKTAAELFDIEAGWPDKPLQLFTSDSTIGRAITEALKGDKSVKQIEEFGNNPKYRGEAVLKSLKDWRNQTIGAFIDVHDLRLVWILIDALTAVSQAGDFDAALDAVMDACESFGFTEIRMYAIDELTELLKSHRSRGLPPEQQSGFAAREVVLPARGNSAHTWMSIDARHPILFYYGEPDIPGGKIKHNDFGLPALAFPNAKFPPAFPKAPGSYWLSIPLFIGDKPFGKIMSTCDSTLQPDIFEMIKLLATQASELLLARQQAQTQRDAREVAIREGLETSMSAVSHNLGSRLASLPVILGRYEEEEQHYSPLRNINEDFAFLVDHAMDTINRTKEMLSKIVPQFSQFDLREMLGRILHASFGIDSEQCDLETSGEMYVVADDHLLESALVELIQNSKQLSPDPSNLRVRILAKTCSKHVQIEFMDNGKGVPEEYKTLIFEEFFTHRPGLKRSTGLGLSFVRRAIEAHGGSVKEIGKPGEGAHFVIHFPLHAPPSQVGEHA